MSIPMVNRLILIIFLMCSTSLSFAKLIDAEISENVETLIAIHPVTRSLNIEVTTRDGIVSLVGVTHDGYHAAKLIEITASTTGVCDVNTTDLTLEYGEPICPDIVLAAKIRGLLIQHHIARYCDPDCWPQTAIGVRACRGMVTLIGESCNPLSISMAAKMARRVCGVKNVVTYWRKHHYTRTHVYPGFAYQFRHWLYK